MSIFKKTPSETCNICGAKIEGATQEVAFENLKAHKLYNHGPRR